mmetsp:Transcript_22595/g.62834  ORF Transcript_22595/g.62834 Transcript_22595/m.62834 type:complete len:759 (-) Transcript_22595:139-2415(-)|eukprot:CAMPEP_0168724574 /NCGR_PEP_ID=MMETSP0724-20121128/3707_1 /TAXON_ID=265536 /ORGANISM="Amphiprora sp., Strain CCMP467" /LENGTH=758 /DNA_ID=CAMNT_0008771329 /DNA_START=731 /DNA_END=3007 /DNA_ORIENTATION=+
MFALKKMNLLRIVWIAILSLPAFVVGGGKKGGKKSGKKSMETDEDLCPPPLEAVPKTSIFDQLTPEEISTTAEYVKMELDLVSEEPSPDECNFADRIFRLDVLPVVKEEALSYLDEDGPMPDRYAKVTVVHAPIEIMDYKVGPLPIGDSTTIEAMLAEGTISWNNRPYFPPGCEFGQVASVIDPVSAVVAPLHKATTGGFCIGEEDCKPGLLWWFSPDPSSSRAERISIVQYQLDPIELGFEVGTGTGTSMATMFYIPLTCKLAHGDPDYSKWYAFDFEYCGQGPYDTAEDLMDAYEGGEITLCDLGITDDYDAMWSGLQRRGPLRPFSDRSPPVVSEPEGPRFEVAGNTVEWMGWEFHVDMHPRFGQTLHDIKFMGNRIIYELSLGETYAAYSGFSGHGEVMYLDSHYFGLGNAAGSLKKGVDCPENAYYFTGYNSLNPYAPFEVPDSYCVYEIVNGETSWRHTFEGEPLGIPRTYLTVRALYTVGNYDYNFALQFFQSGKLKISVDAAGFMSTGTWNENEKQFGVPVQRWQSGSLHDHLFGWKIDMDILGTKNNFAHTQFGVVDAAGPTNTGGTMKAAFVEEVETEAGFKVSTSVPNTFRVYNPNELNAWGRPRGYSLHFEGSIYNILPPEHPWSRAASWSNYNVMVTQYKEDEPLLSNELNFFTPNEPIVDAAAFMDGESTVEEDLVLWVNLGKMHWPRAEDVPVVTNFGTSLDIRPWDYFDENALFDIPAKPEDVESCKPRIGSDFDYGTTPVD